MPQNTDKLEEQFTRHLGRALATLAAIELADDSADLRKAFVEAAAAASEETIRGVLLGQLALAKVDVLEQLAEEEGEDEGEDDEEDDDEDEDDY
jgi:hypothetical protein